MANIAEDRALEAPHKLTLDARRRLTMTGVVEVESFDESQVALATTKGPLVIRGRGLHLQALSLDGGQVTVDGDVDALEYEPEAPAGGFFSRLFG